MKMFDVDKTRMIGLPYGENNYDSRLSRFHLIPERNGRTVRQTDRFAISISCVSVLTRDKKSVHTVVNQYTYIDSSASASVLTFNQSLLSSSCYTNELAIA